MTRNHKNSRRNPIKSLFAIGGIGDLLTALMITTMLKDIAENMVKALQQAIGDQGMEDQPIDEDYVNRLGAALYYVCITVPYQIMRDELGGPINTAWNMLHDASGSATPAAVTELIREGFRELSPTMAAAVTEDIVVKVGKLMLWDWMNGGEPKTEDVFDYDRQFYFHELIRMEASPDEDAIRNEGYKHLMNMSEDERAGLDPELFEIAQKWAEQEGIDKAE